MSEILTQMFSLPVQIALAVVTIIVIMLYLLCIVWVFRDARERNAPAVMWAVIAIIPVAGLVAYCLLRPSLPVLDRDEQYMQLDVLQRQLDEYADCPHCGYPSQKDFVACPRCHHQLRNRCTRCGRTLEPEWTMCPYCTQPVGTGAPPAQRAGAQRPKTPQEKAAPASAGAKKQAPSASGSRDAKTDRQKQRKSASRPAPKKGAPSSGSASSAKTPAGK